MEKPKITIGLLVWNGAKYLPALFESLKKQTFQNFELVVVDNGSSDGSLQIISSNCHPRENGDLPQEVADSHFRGNDKVECMFIQNPTNIGFSAGHNQIFALSNSPYYLALNQDIYLAPDCLEKLVAFVDTHPEAASVAPKLLHWNFNNNKSPSPQAENSNIDSLGVKILRNRRAVDIKNATGYMLQVACLEVFGLSAACALYRRSAIEHADGLFDPDYFAYKEDVDLAYRLRSAGFKSFTLLDTTAWHDRTGADSGQSTDTAQALNKKNQPRLVKYYSYRNHLITLFKNEYWQNLTLDFIWILWYEWKKFVYFLIFDRAVLKGLYDIWNMRKDLKIKRLKIASLRKADWRQIRQSFRLPNS